MKTGLIRIVVVLFWLTCLGSARAHEIRPGYLQIDENTPGSYDVLWKVPSTGRTVLDIQPQFDAALSLKQGGMETLLEGFVVYHYRLTGEKALPGTLVSIRNLAQTTVDVLVNVNLLDGGKHTFLLHPTSSEIAIPRSPGKWTVVAAYTTLGIEHILLGFDHLLFVLALVLLVGGCRKLVGTITAFTVAHSITLAFATLGVVHVPGPPVEACIALSILFLALEILRGLGGKETLTARKPWLIAFTFGLLHGLGFAGALSEIGLPQGEIPLALACFNVGVELGQLAFVAVVLLLIRALKVRPDWPLAARLVPPYAIGAVSAFWVIQRIWTFAS
jgi:hydrogenase/urease accessory protein HupE